MKHTYSIAMTILLAVASSVSIAGNSTPTATDKPTNAATSAAADSIRAKNAALMAKATRDQDETHKKYLGLMTRTENDMARQEQNMARFEKILGTWEQQQAQYQKYLDSLPTSKRGKQ